MTKEPMLVTMDELHQHWMSVDAAGLVIDHQRQARQVRMEDGTVYEAPFEPPPPAPVGDAS